VALTVADRVSAIAVIKPTAPPRTPTAEYLSDDSPTAPAQRFEGAEFADPLCDRGQGQQAVRSDEPGDMPGRDRERHAVQRHGRPEPLPQPGHFDRCLRGYGPYSVDGRHRIDAALSAAPATGDPSLAESLVVNLVDNALRHNRAGGRVDIATKSSTGQAVISVGNTGPLITTDDVDRLFQPFQRLGSERIGHDGGHGLGLAIVRAIASAHGATLAAKARLEGGLDIEVSFPAAPKEIEAERPQ